MKRKYFSFSILALALSLASCAQIQMPTRRNQCTGDTLGISRTINLTQFKGQNFGGITYQKLPLKPFEVVLTFDDGPDENVTPKMLDALYAQCTKATFFMVGKNIAKNPDIARKVAKAGHSIGLHSLSHLSMRSLNNEEQIKDYQANLAIAKRELGNDFAPFYRFPFLHDTEILTQYLNNNGVNIISVDAIGYDWEASATTQSIKDHIFKELDANNNSGIILLHDVQKVNFEALPELLNELKKRNYKIVALQYRD